MIRAAAADLTRESGCCRIMPMAGAKDAATLTLHRKTAFIRRL